MKYSEKADCAENIAECWMQAVRLMRKAVLENDKAMAKVLKDNAKEQIEKAHRIETWI